MTVALTGATGHLGTILVRALIDAGHHVRYLARNESRAPGLEAAERVDGGLFDARALERTLQGASCFVHAAGRISLLEMDGAELERVNVEGTRQALEAARAAGTPRFVYISSIEALPLASGPYPVDESHGIFPDRTVTAYGRSKARATRLVLDSTGAPPERIVVCPTAFLGPPDYRRSSMGRFILDYLHARLPAYVEGGFDFVDVRDVAAAIVSAVGRRSDGANRYPGNAGAGPGRPAPTSTQRIYILGGEYAGVPDLMAMLEGMTGVPRPPICLPAGIAGSVAPLAERYYRITGRSPRFTRGSMRLLSLEATVDSARARTELGYDPRPLAETLRDTVEWFYRHGYLDDANTVFASDGG